ncbi:MAG: NAD(+) synthase [Spirochaetales bacterium]|nr:NAD(+) synthase [Spirochaetales bacterium]
MRDGFIPVAVATPPLRVADLAFNQEAIINYMKVAEESGRTLVVFPELSLTGYTCGDLFLQATLIQGALKSLAAILEASKKLNLIALVGLPLVYSGSLYNCAVALKGGEILGVVPKGNLINGQEYNDGRYFSEPPQTNGTITLFGQEVPFGAKLLFQSKKVANFTFAIEICNDLWIPNPPSISHSQAGALIIANLSASSALIGKEAYRRSLVAGQSARLYAGYLYAAAGSGESTSEMVFLGHNFITENGEVLKEELFPFEGIANGEIDVDYLASERIRSGNFSTLHDESYQVIRFDHNLTDVKLERTYERHPFIPNGESAPYEQALMIQSVGLLKRLHHIGGEKVVIGLSGGLDSTLALIVAVEAFKRGSLPLSGIIGVTMPCFGTTSASLRLAETLAQQFGITLRKIDITKAVEQHFEDIGHPPTLHDITYENSQARERTQILMDIANQEGGIVIGTGDLSELALGWATYNGDLMSMYAVNASVPKTLVRHLVTYYGEQSGNEELKRTLTEVVEAPISPELLPTKGGETTQKTEEVVGPYELHDFFLYHSIRRGSTPRKVARLAKETFKGDYSEQEVLQWLKLFYKRFFANQFKRSVLPEGPMIGSLSLNPRSSWKMPSDARVEEWLAELE